MTVNYADIGKRVKEIRLRKSITQELLAELADISIPHLSNIERGKTKLGLPTIVKIANALAVSVDEILCGSLMQGKAVLQSEFATLLADCTAEEAGVILDTVKTLKKSLRGK